MLPVTQQFKDAMVAPVRTFKAEADVHINPSSVGEVTTFTHEDAIKTIEIQRVGDNSKFFGFGICQRLNMKIVDLENSHPPLAGTTIKVRLGIVLPDGSTEFISYPTFKITERNRMEEEGQLSIIGYDTLDEAGAHTVAELYLEPPFNIKEVISKVATVLNLGLAFDNVPDDDYAFNLEYAEGANFDGTETLRDCLNAAAEATQTIYFIDENDILRFKRLDVKGTPVATITENDYFTFHHKDNRRLDEIWHVTELGDNVMATGGTISSKQFVRNNPFWEVRKEDIGEVVENALANVDGMVISQFECEWRGNLPLEIGDKIEIKQVCIDGHIQPAFIFDDVITYDGGYSQKTQWVYNDSDAETAANPTNIGEAISQTFAKVDKVNREISLVASQVNNNKEDISALKVSTTDITAAVETVQKQVEDNKDAMDSQLVDIRNKVEMAVTAEDLTIKVQEEISNGVNKVTTATGFTFDEDGLTVEKTGSEMKTQITEDGMVVYRDDSPVLIADNTGVDAHNLHAINYLIIGEYSRFEDYINDAGEPRTGCFWLK